MATKDPRVDAYIERAAPFAQPILKRIRRLVHTACPDIVEGMKWSFPHFDYKGMFCGMAAFKGHCTFGFWKHKLLEQELPAPGRKDEKGMGQFGCLRSEDDLPGDAAMIRIIKAAARLNDDGVKVPRPKRTAKAPVKPPVYFLAAVKKNKAAHMAYESFTASHRREYVEWVTEAKTEETRLRRLTQAVSWMAEGKPRNWKYERS